MIKQKKSQHEIAGFVLIVLIVSIIGVVFLSITLGNPRIERQTSLEVSNILLASMYHTTNCAVNYIPQYRDVQDLIKECYNNNVGNHRECLGGGNVCEALKNNLKDIIDKSLIIDENSKNKAYKINIYYSDEESNEDILSFEDGNFNNCTAIVGGSHPVPVSSFGFGKIETELSVCKG